MQFIDLNDDRVYTLADLKKDWQEFREEGPENHAAGFQDGVLRNPDGDHQRTE